mmetsp:Transcript_7619/g.20394  ORF Transcript_7619/g.20394 Transcript_7619/m.20394 type:complete len:293 (+) Transcript_7619:1098-1976(+)
MIIETQKRAGEPSTKPTNIFESSRINGDRIIFRTRPSRMSRKTRQTSASLLNSNSSDRFWITRLRHTSPTDTTVTVKSNQFHRLSGPHQYVREPCIRILMFISAMNMTAKTASSISHPSQSGSLSLLRPRQTMLASTVSETNVFKTVSTFEDFGVGASPSTDTSIARDSRFRDSLAITSSTSCFSKASCIFSTPRESLGCTRFGRSDIKTASTKISKPMPLSRRAEPDKLPTGGGTTLDSAEVLESTLAPHELALLWATLSNSCSALSRKPSLTLRRPRFASTCPRLSAVTV